MAVCTQCKGAGSVRRFERCSTCAGQGFYQREDETQVTLTRCPDCGGDGHVDSFLNPEYDNGSGFLATLAMARAGFGLLSKGSDYQFMARRALGEINLTWSDTGPHGSLSEDDQAAIRRARREKGLGSGWVEVAATCTACLGKGEVDA